VDPEATAQAREAERDRRKQRGVPYADFVREWVTEGPPADLPFYGSWGDREVIYAGGYAGQPHVRMRSDAIQDVVVPHPREVRIASLEATVAELQAKLREQ
jgi:hypothetical protein